MAWADAKARIKTVLEGVSITTPETQSIARVFSDPPGSVPGGDVPCFIIYPPSVAVGRGTARREKAYVVRLRLLVMDAGIEQAAAFVDAYREALVDAFDADVTLNGTASPGIIGQTVEEASGFSYGGIDYTGFDCLLTVSMVEAKAFGP